MLFSKQNKKLPDVFQTAIVPDALRTQILWILRQQYGDDNRSYIVVRDFVCKERGIHSLANSSDPLVDVFSCIQHGKDTSQILDCVQILLGILSTNKGPYGSDPPKAIYEFNRYCLESGFGYEFDIQSNTLIPIDSSLLHQEAVRPALHLLSKKTFATANREYLTAFEHFKKTEYGDCLTECCKSLESTLKIIANKKKWTVDPKATFQPLLKVYLQETGLDAYWEQPLVVLATLRNRKDAHGAGTTPHDVPKHEAQYALHATGSAIVFLVEGAGL